MAPAGSPGSPTLGSLQRVLRERGLTISAAESCTGGLVCAALTDLPGSSDYFIGGIVTYANRAKVKQLGVDQATLDRVGAVSPEVAEQMARGVKALFGSDIALSVTGIAGPGAEGPKPAGLTYVGVAFEDRVDVREFQWTGDRAANRADSVEAALQMAVAILS